MAIATPTRHRSAPPRAGRARRPHELAPRQVAHPGDAEPFSDEERTAAGQKPLEIPKTADEQRKERDAKAKADYDERLAAVKKKRSARTRANGELRQSAASVAGGAESSAKSLGSLLRGHGATTLGGLIGGLFAFAMGRALLNGGPAEVGGWIGAKFINKPYTPPSTKASTPAVPATATLASIAVPASSGQPASQIVAA
jgi:hypothetical protein